MPNIGKKERMSCPKCGEPTTHQYKNNAEGKPFWSCLMCEAAARYTPEQLEKIKAKRKGWKVTV